MSATIMRFPRDWIGVIGNLRTRLASVDQLDAKLGVGLNFNRLVRAQPGPREKGKEWHDGCCTPLDPALAHEKGHSEGPQEDTSSSSQTFSGASPLSWLLWATGLSDVTRAAPAVDSPGVRELLSSHVDFVGIRLAARGRNGGWTRCLVINCDRIFDLHWLDALLPVKRHNTVCPWMQCLCTL